MLTKIWIVIKICAMTQKPKLKSKKGEVFAFRIRPEHLKILEEMAAKENRNRSNMADVLLQEAMRARGVKV